MTKNTGILKVEKKSLADEVSGLIQKRISSGEMPVGTKLPTEKELSDMYGVGRSTVREAVSVLANIGLLRVMQGKGTFVVSQYATNEPIAQRLKRAQSCDLDEIRQILEMKIAEKAAQKRTKADIKNIEARLAEIAEANASGDLEKSIDADIKFHTAIAEAPTTKFCWSSTKWPPRICASGMRKSTVLRKSSRRRTGCIRSLS